MSGTDDPREELEQRIRDGRASRDAVEKAIGLWRRTLRNGVSLASGELARIEMRDLYHLLCDNRIARKPWRIGRLLSNVFEIRTAKEGRRIGYSRWDEEGETRAGYVILEANNRVRSMHLILENRLQRMRTKGAVLWTR